MTRIEGMNMQDGQDAGRKKSTVNDITLAEMQQQVNEWITTTGVRYFNELTNLAILTEEVGEVARLIARQYGEQSFKTSDEGKELGDELADVLWVVICLANQTGVNLTEAFQKNMKKKSERDKDRHHQNQKLR
jgi:NTP pyrophosphatase (non-canonical NTP hydrolase)